MSAISVRADSTARTGTSGARSGAILAIASAVSIVANYIFLLAAGRLLGSESYGSLAALLGLLAVVLMPAAALQMAVSREISQRLAVGDESGAHAFARTTLRAAAVATVPLLSWRSRSPPRSPTCSTSSRSASSCSPKPRSRPHSSLPVAMGVLQGSQRFHALAALYVVPFVLRLGDPRHRGRARLSARRRGLRDGR